ncbi:hypothetical protein Q4560_05020 [Celeribacter halophilus]|uniref:hypothetical protein n=1 Tax=Celeribacter halophilus TaxID=576117 RepID=UPI0026E35DC8|nr:hypothetical protein [Celeribacter halophilus]MDO6722618.1 hypothetical protein [Celeribacter halophilus]
MTKENTDFVTLYFDIPKGATVNLATLGRSLIEFERLAKEVSAQKNPFTQFDLGFDSSEEGSLRLITRLRGIIDEADLQYLAKLIVVALLLQPVVGIVSEDIWRTALEKAGYPQQKMTSEEVSRIANEVTTILRDETVKHSRNNLYTTLEADETIIAFGAKPDKSRGKPKSLVKRDQFPSMGLPDTGDVEADPVPRTVTTEVTLVLEKPVLRAASKSMWEFRFDGQKISARITDTEFLDEALTGKVAIPLIEGLEMTVALEDHQEFKDGVWQHKSYTISKVLDWKKPAYQPSLSFSDRRQNENDDD